MPARYHVISPSIWDRRFRNLSSDTKIVAFYVWSCRSRSSEGLYALPLAYVIADSGLCEEEVLSAFEDLARADLVEYDADHEIVFDKLALRHNPLREPDNRIRGAVSQLEQVELTGSPLLQKFALHASRFSPDLALALHERYPWLGAPREPLASPSEGASREELSSYEESRVEKSSDFGSGSSDSDSQEGFQNRGRAAFSTWVAQR